MKLLLKTLADSGDISPLSYFFACFVAEKSESEIDSLLAYSAALVSQNNQNGDVCIELDQYLEQPLFNSSRIEPDDMPPGIDPGAWRKSLLESVCVGIAGENTPLILEHNRLYLYRYWYYESRVAELINSRLQPLADIDTNKLSRQLKQLFPGHDGQQVINSQALAVALAAGRQFVVISGGPGSGKTTTVVKILAMLVSQHPAMRIELAAPTGKAAARMMESIQARKNDSNIDPALWDLIPQSASTVHRLLGYNKHRFKHCASNPVALDCIVIDEASMLDLTLTYRLLDALPESARVILIGDRDQLASVAAGNVLGDITGHGRAFGYRQLQCENLASILDCTPGDLPQTEAPGPISDSIALLTQSYRFNQDSEIGRLASLIIQGDGDGAVELLKTSSTDLSLQSPSDKSIKLPALDRVLGSFRSVINSNNVAEALDLFETTRILCAIHTGPFGVDEINRLVRDRVHSDRQFETDNNYHGKPLLITANDYELNLFNGDTGLLWRNEEGKLQACFRGDDQSIRHLPIYSLPAHNEAWAMTVHKSQGSEFDSVLLILPDDEESIAVSRELLYTGVTRARRNLMVYSSDKVLIAACCKLSQRSSGLASKLGWEFL